MSSAFSAEGYSYSSSYNNGHNNNGNNDHSFTITKSPQESPLLKPHSYKWTPTGPGSSHQPPQMGYHHRSFNDDHHHMNNYNQFRNQHAAVMNPVVDPRAAQRQTEMITASFGRFRGYGPGMIGQAPGYGPSRDNADRLVTNSMNLPGEDGTTPRNWRNGFQNPAIWQIEKMIDEHDDYPRRYGLGDQQEEIEMPMKKRKKHRYRQVNQGIGGNGSSSRSKKVTESSSRSEATKKSPASGNNQPPEKVNEVGEEGKEGDQATENSEKNQKKMQKKNEISGKKELEKVQESSHREDINEPQSGQGLELNEGEGGDVHLHSRGGVEKTQQQPKAEIHRLNHHKVDEIAHDDKEVGLDPALIDDINLDLAFQTGPLYSKISPKLTNKLTALGREEGPGPNYSLTAPDENLAKKLTSSFRRKQNNSHLVSQNGNNSQFESYGGGDLDKD